MIVKLGFSVMKRLKKYARMFLMIGLFTLTMNIFAQDQDFYIYLCFGQSNMEGQGTIEGMDQTVDSSFQVMQALNCPNLGRTKESWYTAVPPLCQCYSNLCPADYFGRTMVLNLPDSIRVGVINVSVGGCDIRLFDKDIYQDYDSTHLESWFLDKLEDYEWNPYQYLIDLAQLAQLDGIIKGILLHQGETNTGQAEWPSYVKKIYNDMLTDLSLEADSVPILAGELLSAPGNCCASMNTIINRLPDTIPTAYVISSSGCTGQDEAHFDSEGYRKFGIRYAMTMFSIMGYDTTDLEYPETSGIDSEEIPDGYVLVQNYPNPCSPTTTIKYYLPQKARVTLEVLDVAGRTIETLINNVESIGEHTINYDGSGLSSGTYFYRLSTSTGFSQSKKLLLIK